MEVWPQVEKLAGSVLRTIEQGKPFEITHVGPDLLLVRPRRGTADRPIPRRVFEEAFADLAARGELTRSDIQHRYSEFSHAYVAAILSVLPGVTPRRHPVRLVYRPDTSPEQNPLTPSA